MPTQLHLVRADSVPLAATVIETAAREPGTTVTVVVLDDAAPPVLPAGVRVLRMGGDHLDYPGLLDLIFEHDRVVLW
jgi:hypothetical protein